jgi:uncharacterized protein
MEFSDGEKLIINLLADLHKRLGFEAGEHELDPIFIADSINDGHPWAILRRYQGYGLSGHYPPEVREVVEIFDMWREVEWSFKKLTEEEKLQIVAELGGAPHFEGFDAHEGQLEIARKLATGRNWEEFQGRVVDTHSPTRDLYKRMLDVYKALRAEDPTMTFAVEQIIAIAKAQFIS